MSPGVNQPRCKISSSAREISSEQSEAGSKVTHGQAEHDQSEAGIHRQMSDVCVQKNSGEEPPPFAMRHGSGVHQTRVAKGGARIGLNPEKHADEKHPAE